MTNDNMDAASEPPVSSDVALRHLRFGWWSLVVFLTLGLVLETLLGLKFETYLGADYDTRRLLWRLAHAHGTLTALLNLAFAWTVARGSLTQSLARKASPLYLAGSVLLPGGFFLGGIGFHGADPGIGVFLSPLGGLALILAVLLTAAGLRRRTADG